HARNGSARERLDGRRGARREGSGGRGGRLDVLRHRGRSRAGHRRGARRRRDGPPGTLGARRGPRMVTAEELTARREEIAAAPDLAALLAHLAERAAHLATLAALADNAAAADRAVEILRAYTRTYWGYANQDNVLGPSRLFFSTYLESIWIGNFLAAAALLRACGRLEKVAAGAVSGVAEEAANLIGEFDEGFSNRQTWNNAALAAIAGWFEDEDLAKRAIEGPTGLLEHLLRGFGRDGMWYEGENYHLFALRGLLTGARWARLAGVDI